MVTMVLNGDVLTVPSGAVELYRAIGYQVKNPEPVFVEPSSAPVPVKPVETRRFTNLEEKPLTLWTKDELKEYAREKGIDLTGTKSANDARDLIREYMREN